MSQFITHLQSIYGHHRLAYVYQRLRKEQRGSELKNIVVTRQNVSHVGGQIVPHKNVRYQGEVKDKSLGEYYDSQVRSAHVRRKLDLLDFQCSRD